ncbi:MAG: hypothetical protein SGPRY_000715, partial [Prymnesium sp.]
MASSTTRLLLLSFFACEAAAFRALPLLRKSAPLTTFSHRPPHPILTRSAPPTALLEPPFEVSALGVAELGAAALGFVLLLAFVAGKGSLEAGAALMLIFFQGDPEERDKSGANESGWLIKAALAVTPSAWKKAYMGDNEEELGEGEDRPKLDLPSWQGEEARELVEPE